MKLEDDACPYLGIAYWSLTDGSSVVVGLVGEEEDSLWVQGIHACTSGDGHVSAWYYGDTGWEFTDRFLEVMKLFSFDDNFECIKKYKNFPEELKALLEVSS